MTNEELVVLYQEGDKQALESLIKSNTGIVRKIALKYNALNELLELDDLIQSGTMGLIAAANKYDITMENRANFITYAFHYIEREIYNCVNGRSSRNINNNKFYKTFKSLNEIVGDDEETELLDLVNSHDRGIENVDEQLYLKELRKELEMAMIDYNSLREREVLKLHYGWNIKPIVLSEIGELLQVSTERIRQIEYNALRKLFNSKWGRTRGRHYAGEIICTHNYSYSYREVEKKIDFDEYFKDINIKFENVLNFEI
ncbi:sigma-70 family RNA polymerase sigma factor [Clostridium sp.]|uniref:sigma-70 family RNA polymerase sigma factor n=1 Tax=Clostridium sp. TaxID=1506 RepID=UPI0028445E20|nr:sigma-70 family RNA polymerase sigma factor [Clostridium sp.]MDR3594922.1 sigma-70 family RNA polymerase sigma factor [Clostridium sp.]